MSPGSILHRPFLFQTELTQKNERIEELEEALRESVRITAQREMDMADLQVEIDTSKSAVSVLFFRLFMVL